MTERINRSWREQRKAVIGTDVQTGSQMEYISVWQASHQVSASMLCNPDTAKKEIKKAIATGKPRYGMTWKFKDQ